MGERPRDEDRGFEGRLGEGEPSGMRPPGPEPVKVRVRDRRVRVDDDGWPEGAPVEQPTAPGEQPTAAPGEQAAASGEQPTAAGEQAAAPGLEEQLAEARRLADERYDQLLRLKAEFENFRKRMIREQTEIVEHASRRLVEKLLPVLDDLERAVESARAHASDEGIVRGVEMVLAKVREVLAAEGLERTGAAGERFDPHHHEAMSSEPGPGPEPQVLEVVRPGYRMKGKVLRPALVVVSRPQEAPAGGEAGPTNEPPAGGEALGHPPKPQQEAE